MLLSETHVFWFQAADSPVLSVHQKGVHQSQQFPRQYQHCWTEALQTAPSCQVIPAQRSHTVKTTHTHTLHTSHFTMHTIHTSLHVSFILRYTMPHYFNVCDSFGLINPSQTWESITFRRNPTNAVIYINTTSLTLLRSYILKPLRGHHHQGVLTHFVSRVNKMHVLK